MTIVPANLSIPPLSLPQAKVHAAAPLHTGSGTSASRSALGDAAPQAAPRVDRFEPGTQASPGTQNPAAKQNSPDMQQPGMSAPRTEVSVQLMMQFREKVVAAYQQLMQMQV